MSRQPGRLSKPFFLAATPMPAARNPVNVSDKAYSRLTNAFLGGFQVDTLEESESPLRVPVPHHSLVKPVQKLP